MRYFLVVMASLLLLTGCQTGRALHLKSRPNVVQSAYLTVPEKPFAVVIFSGGGSGTLAKTGTFGEEIARAGMIAASLDTPTDQTSWYGGMPPAFRSSLTHVKDIEAVVARLREEFNLPIWFAGLSLGTVSAVNYATEKGPHPIDGIVLLSSVSSRIFYWMDKVKVPILAIVHKDDGCVHTPPDDVRTIVSKATSSVNAMSKIIIGGDDRGSDPCSGPVYHTFHGVRDEVAAEIAKFIKANTR